MHIIRSGLISLSLVFAFACGGKSSNSDTESRSTVSDEDDDDDDATESDAGSQSSTGTDRTDTDTDTDTDDEAEPDDTAGDGDPEDTEVDPDEPSPDPTAPNTSPTGPNPVPTAPVAPSPGMPVDPSQCSEYLSSSSTYCNFERSCPSEYQYVSCGQAGDVWQCSCGTNLMNLSYDLNGVNQSNACDFMLEQCEGNSTPMFTGERECSGIRDAQAGYCQIQERCGSSGDLGGGVTAWRVDSHSYASCYEEGRGSAWCDCQDANVFRSMNLGGVDISTGAACDLVLDYCKSGGQFENVGAPQCEVASQYTSTNDCGISLQCAQTVNMGDGTTAEISSYRGVGCSALNANQFTCSCNDTGIGFVVDRPASGSACTGAVDVCDKLSAGIQFEGDVECSPESRNSGPGYCGRNDVCGQTVDVDGTELTVNGYLNVQCSDQGDGNYYCSCYSGNQSGSVEAGAHASPRAACDAAMDQCREIIDVQVGGGGAIGRPIPLAGAPVAAPSSRASAE